MRGRIENNMERIVILLDPSASKSATCSRKLFNVVVKGYRERGTNNDLVFGSGFHHWRASMSRGEGPKIAQSKGLAVFDTTEDLVWKEEKAWLNKDYLRATIAHDFSVIMEKPLEPPIKFSDGSLAVEHAWSIPFYRTDKVEVILCGTVDRIIMLPSGILCLTDYKTTSAWQKAPFLNGYKISSQLIFYAWALRFLKNMPEATKYHTLDVERIATRIDAVFVAKDKPAEFRSTDVTIFSDDKFADFELVLRKQVKELVEHTEAGYAPREGLYNGNCDSGIPFPNKCPFYYACAASDPSIEQQVLERTFRKNLYNPLQFQK